MTVERDIENAYADDRNPHEDRLICFLKCVFFWFVVELLGILCLYAFAIVGLVKNWDTVGDCNSSHLRELVITFLTVFILQTGLRLSASNNSNSDHSRRATFMPSEVVVILLFGGIAVWSGVEVLNIACTNIKNTLLFNVGLTIFIFSTLMGGFKFLNLVITVCSTMASVLFRSTV